MSHKSYLVTVFISSLVLAQLAATAAYYAIANKSRNFVELKEYFPLTRAVNGIIAGADTAIAVVLVHYLRSSRTGFRSTDVAVNKLILFSVNTGLVTSLMAIMALVTGFVFPNTLIFLIFYECLSRCESKVCRWLKMFAYQLTIP